VPRAEERDIALILGFGSSYSINEMFSAKLEYNYSKPEYNFDDVKVHSTIHRVKLGISYQL